MSMDIRKGYGEEGASPKAIETSSNVFEAGHHLHPKRTATGVRSAPVMILSMYIHTLQDALFIGYKHSLDNARSYAFSQRTSSTHWIEDESFNDSDISGVTYILTIPASQGEGQDSRWASKAN
ncbi:hypothetical protein TNCV_879341 [Trichonephila clavipes]|nr:hypothetical protein TNCV_879341 [Trichonephila clavipes]